MTAHVIDLEKSVPKNGNRSEKEVDKKLYILHERQKGSY